MRNKSEIKKALKEMNIRRSQSMLDMVEYKPNGIKYDTEIIRKMESIDVTIRTLQWVLNENDVAATKKPRSK